MEKQATTRVKWKDKGRYWYGTVVESSLADSGEKWILVVSATLPRKYRMPESRAIILPPENDEYDRHIAYHYQKAVRLSDSVQGCQKGKLLRFPVGNTTAYYVVLEVTESIAILEWRGFGAERAMEPSLGIRAFADRRVCEDMIRADEERPRLVGHSG